MIHRHGSSSVLMKKIMTFEQGIKWEGGRITEKWLHDSWLLEHQL